MHITVPHSTLGHVTWRVMYIAEGKAHLIAAPLQTPMSFETAKKYVNTEFHAGLPADFRSGLCGDIKLPDAIDFLFGSRFFSTWTPYMFWLDDWTAPKNETTAAVCDRSGELKYSSTCKRALVCPLCDLAKEVIKSYLNASTHVYTLTK